MMLIMQSFFGMNFFVFDTNTLRLKGSPMVWIYVLSSIFLTVITGMLYYFVTRPSESEQAEETKTPDIGDEKVRPRRFAGLRKHLQGTSSEKSPHGV
jgi:hypothetical protein